MSATGIAVGVDLQLVDGLVGERVRPGGIAGFKTKRRMHIHDQDRLAIVARFAERVEVGQVEARIAVRKPERRPGIVVRHRASLPCGAQRQATGPSRRPLQLHLRIEPKRRRREKSGQPRSQPAALVPSRQSRKVGAGTKWSSDQHKGWVISRAQASTAMRRTGSRQ